VNILLIDKVAIAIERFKIFEPTDGYYLAFSGGKDSQVIYKLAEMSGVKFDAHYNITTVDPPELIYFIHEKYPTVIFDKPKRTMWQLIPDKLMPPTRMVRYCCEELKERGGEGRTVVTGVRAAESVRRRSWQMFQPCKRRHGHILNTIIDWDETDVWDFIKKEIGYHCELYDRGWQRIGCLGCPNSPDQIRQLNENPKIKKSYIHAFGKMLERRKERGLETTWTTAQEVMDWWLANDKGVKIDENQKQFVFEV
jgi:phosphoadenosine phosphosulfate reductase